jgi:hypothetical protein
VASSYSRKRRPGRFRTGQGGTARPLVCPNLASPAFPGVGGVRC